MLMLVMLLQLAEHTQHIAVGNTDDALYSRRRHATTTPSCTHRPTTAAAAAADSSNDGGGGMYVCMYVS